MPAPKHSTTHEHFFSYPEHNYIQPDGITDDVSGRYDAYETRHDECGVWSVQTDQNWECKNFAEARRMARALADEYAALHRGAK